MLKLSWNTTLNREHMSVHSSTVRNAVVASGVSCMASISARVSELFKFHSVERYVGRASIPKAKGTWDVPRTGILSLCLKVRWMSADHRGRLKIHWTQPVNASTGLSDTPAGVFRAVCTARWVAAPTPFPQFSHFVTQQAFTYVY